jgi:O-methyltransferase involved in polyketide biosynthesis
MRERAESEKVSPTAYATGYFWHRHGLSHPALLVPEGEKLERRFSFLIGAVKFVSGLSIEALMLSRHKGIDAVLSRHIESGRVGQVIELAAGLSARGWRFTQRYGDTLAYVETDLPAMAKLKQRLLADGGLAGPRHRVVPVNALLNSGPASLHELAETLDPKVGTAVITEGLLSYLDPHSARGVWRRIAEALRRFPFGVYLSDAYLSRDRYGLGAKMFRGAIQYFVRGRMHIHFETEADAGEQLRAAGFDEVQMHEPAALAETRELAQVLGGNRVRILDARLGRRRA